LRGALWVLGDAGPLHLLDRTGELGVLALERGLRHPPHPPPDQRQLHQPADDRLEVLPTCDPAQQREDAEHDQQRGQHVERDQDDPEVGDHARIVASRGSPTTPSSTSTRPSRASESTASASSSASGCFAAATRQAGTYLRERGQYRDAEPLLVQALSIREQHLGLEHPDTAANLNNLATLYYR